jgi:hypothetical protein
MVLRGRQIRHAGFSWFSKDARVDAMLYQRREKCGAVFPRDNAERVFVEIMRKL